MPRWRAHWPNFTSSDAGGTRQSLDAYSGSLYLYPYRPPPIPCGSLASASSWWSESGKDRRDEFVNKLSSLRRTGARRSGKVAIKFSIMERNRRIT